jgi:serine/threonine protein kinase
LFDFGLSRELPKRKGQSHRDKDLEDEETFHMSGVGTQRYMAPEIISTRRYNLRADVYSWSMVVLEIMTLNKPFLEYNPEEHALNVAKFGERPRLVDKYVPGMEDPSDETELPAKEETSNGPESQNSNEEQGQSEVAAAHKPAKAEPTRKNAKMVSIRGWPVGLASLLEESWSQDVGSRLSTNAVLQRLDAINLEFDHSVSLQEVNTEQHSATEPSVSFSNEIASTFGDPQNREVVLEFPSHFSPRHQLSARQRVDQYGNQQHQKFLRHFPMVITRQDSDCNFGDKQSEASATSYLELTTTSGSTTLHDSNSTA